MPEVRWNKSLSVGNSISKHLIISCYVCSNPLRLFAHFIVGETGLEWLISLFKITQLSGGAGIWTRQPAKLVLCKRNKPFFLSDMNHSRLKVREKWCDQLNVPGMLAILWEWSDEKSQFDWPGCSGGSKINIISLTIIIIDISPTVNKVV